ncbi:MAG TPA: hypothetical protein PKX23_16025 [Verrucomicrobiota bacterium]|jgi:hypothetical protein|nr:hypothetical protein [Verrucomicrobiota bacterium]HRT07190.1 hypothetical protein [Candidatus Paceibacterota bacterium]HRT57178.1 hypothetical protein [Candidatus Paceibacterota bacterium]
MRVLLFDSSSRRYYHSAGRWTSDPAQALDFGGTVQAAHTAFHQRLQSFEIILAFDDAHMSDLRVPLTLTPSSPGPATADV